MNKLDKFWEVLNKYRKEEVESPYDQGRTTWCHLLYKHKGEIHRFEVRGASYIQNVQESSLDIISISVVNWTICAGTASVTLNNDTIDKWVIEEEPTAKLLYYVE